MLSNALFCVSNCDKITPGMLLRRRGACSTPTWTPFDANNTIVHLLPRRGYAHERG